ncbi:D-alanyl-D-alanine carboxypeptidase [Tissierella sp. Yu-01]|uniref:D-alanyl-D-alanine carboxypeptidase family protein n=1 Tax=Tissierella sp. Yu-01 TaxID=3035694 RepID=UPI00240D4D5D|nr:D-alanyl-D-alanine carboxypeptidase [Tissierella sp. Yu-01]WFA08881.1 D-alanyl-D-alanine carboxypeptidase [Tissierella sp. Yu-01]
MRQKRRKKKHLRKFILTLIIFLSICMLFKTVYSYLPFYKNKLALDKDKTTDDNMIQSIQDELFSPYAILVSLNNQNVVFETGSEERIFPASLTKIMTVLVAIENIPDLHELIILPEEIFPDLYTANASMAGFLPGEEVAAVDLLYGTLLPSGADASLGLALRVSGSESEFSKLMNKKAKEIGMGDTHFTNVTGLHDDNHYTTVKDIAKLLEYALKNKTFYEIFTTIRRSTSNTNRHPGGITFYSTLYKKTNTLEFDGGEIIGGKTGYTEEAGLCLASLAEKNGSKYILVTAGAAGDNYSEQYHIIDALTVYGKYLNN